LGGQGHLSVSKSAKVGNNLRNFSGGITGAESGPWYPSVDSRADTHLAFDITGQDETVTLAISASTFENYDPTYNPGLYFILFPLVSSKPRNQETRKAVLEAYYQKTFKLSCQGTPRENEPVYLESVQYCDVDGDGIEEAIVTGSSCVSGTGGPDIHDVLKLNTDGTVSNITPREASRSGDTFNGLPISDHLVGNRNYDISFKKGLLYYIFRDASKRPEPLVLKFKWAKGQFRLIEVIKNGLTLRSTRTQPLRFGSINHRAAKVAPVSSNR